MPKATTQTGLTAQETVYVTEKVLNNSTKVNAARKAYPKSENPSQMANDVETRPRIQEAISQLSLELEKAGVTNNKIAQRIAEGVDATWQNEPDLKMRHEYIKTAVKIKEEKKPEVGLHVHKHQHFMNELGKAAREE